VTGVARLRSLAVLTLVLALAACAGDGGAGSPGASIDGSPSAAIGASPDASGASPSASAEASPSAAAGEFTNPVLEANFADPFLLEVDGTYYGYATGNLTWNIQVTRSEDLVTWAPTKEALPKLPLWQPVSKGLTWAPEVIRTDAGYVMHYTTRDVQAGKQCLSVATAETPEGPFTDTSEEPLVCQLDLGGSIDSSPFRDEDGSLWLVWKNDGNCCGKHTHFYVAPLDESGRTLTGEAVDVGLDNDRPWERNLIEAPQIIRHEDTYYLFYSANDYGSPNYAVGYATSDDIEGPYVDAEENPILETAGEAAGPGHQTIVEDDDGELWMAYHAWDPDRVGDSVGGRRALWLDRLTFEDGKPVVHGPTTDPQPAP
jgi:beta-xylosidase